LNILTAENLAEEVTEGRFIALRNYWLGMHFLWQDKVARPSFYRGCDVMIHTGSMYQVSTWFALLWTRMSGTRILLWTHGVSGNEHGLKGLIRKCFYKLSDGLLLYGYRAREALIERGFKPDTLYVVYNSLDYDKQKYWRENVSADSVLRLKTRCFTDPSLPTLVYVGRLTPEKQPLLMLDLAAHLKSCGKPVNILIIGDGPELEPLRKGVAARDLQANVHLHGACHEEEELAVFLTAADIALMPGYVGLSAMHYLAYGLPVLTSNDLDNQKPEAEAIVEGSTGAFYTHGNTDSLATKVVEWLDALGPDTRERCIAQIEQFYNPDVQRDIVKYACRGLPASKQPHSRT